MLLDFSHTFAVDPNFRVGYAQNWQLAVQTDLPGALQMTATYLGIKGTRGVQEYLPRPIRSVHESMPGMSRRLCVSHLRRQLDARGRQLQLRRRLRSGFTATLQYTYSKLIDNDAVLRGQGPVATTTTTATRTGITTGTASPTPQTPAIAQNWLNLSAERGLSTFDQRNSVNAQIQYATGVGLGGGSLWNGWRGRLLKRWTVLGQITAGSGLPETPVYLAAVTGTGVTGSIGPSVTGAPLFAAPAGHHLNPQLTGRLRRVNGEMREETQSPAQASSSSTPRWRGPFD